MRFLKLAITMAIMAAALMAYVDGASATTITSPTGTVYTSSITMDSTTWVLEGPPASVNCSNSHLEYTITQHGAGVTLKGTVNTHSMTGCNFPVAIEQGGTIEYHANKPSSIHETCIKGNYC